MKGVGGDVGRGTGDWAGWVGGSEEGESWGGREEGAGCTAVVTHCNASMSIHLLPLHSLSLSHSLGADIKEMGVSKG